MVLYETSPAIRALTENPKMSYLYQVNFEKVFTDGILKGRRYTNAHLRFTSWHDAEKFRLACDGKTEVKECAGGGTYVRECPILTALE